MALTVEDGSQVANADSYVSVADARTYLAARGESFTADDAVAEQNLLKAMDVLEAKRSQYKGTKVSSTQSLQWPRDEVYIDGLLFAKDAIPDELVHAQAYLALYAQDYALQAVGSGRIVVKEKVDVIERSYSDSKVGTVQAQFNKVDDLLAPLLSNAGLSLVNVRV